MEPRAIQQMPIDKIECIAQVRKRFDEETIAGLAQSLKEVGFLQPISVRRNGDQWIVSDGERRLRAARLAGFASVPVMIDDREIGEAGLTQRQLIANCQREDFSPLEKSTAIERLMRETKWSGAQVAVKLGFSPATVSKLLALLTLPEQVRERVESGDIALSAAYQLTRVKDGTSQAQLASEVANGLSRDGLSARLKSAKQIQGHPPKSAPKKVTALLGQARAVTVCGTGLTLERFIQWLEELLDKARKARPKGLELDTFVKMLRDQSKKDDAAGSSSRVS